MASNYCNVYSTYSCIRCCRNITENVLFHVMTLPVNGPFQMTLRRKWKTYFPSDETPSQFPPVSCQYQHRPLGLRTQQPFQDGILTSSVEIISLSNLLKNNQTTTLTTSFTSCNSSRSQPKMPHLHAKLWSHCLIFPLLLRNHKWSATQCSLWECSAVQCAGIDEVSVGIPGSAR